MRHSDLERIARRQGVTDERVLDAMGRVDRRGFVPAHLVREAGMDGPLPIGEGQTTSQPSLIGQMLQAAELTPDSRVLEIGTGYGYQTALLCHLAADVHSIERYASLAEAARANLAAAGLSARVAVGDGAEGLPDAAPFDAIIVSAAAEEIPGAWSEQLAPGGRLVVPVGGRDAQFVQVQRRQADGLSPPERLVGVRFVPLVRGPHPRSPGDT